MQVDRLPKLAESSIPQAMDMDRRHRDGFASGLDPCIFNLGRAGASKTCDHFIAFGNLILDRHM